MKLPKHFDVIIMGGGLAGMTLGVQIKKKRPETSVLIVERREFPVPETAFKIGESTICVGAGYFADVIGLKEHMLNDQTIKAGLRYFFKFGDNTDISKRVEVGGTDIPKYPSYQVDRGKFENTLKELCMDLHVIFIDQTKVDKFEIGEEEHNLTLITKSEDELQTNLTLDITKVSCKWLLDASGRAGLIKKKLILDKDVDHNVNSVWFRIDLSIDVDSWSQDRSWLERVPKEFRKYDTVHLVGPGYWIWIITLPNNRTSVGLVAEGDMHPLNSINRFEKLLEWLKVHEPQMAKQLENNANKLLDFNGMRHYAHGCKQLFSKDRWCITGDAGVFADPFYSIGSDLIAMGNTLITELVVRDLSGKDISKHIEFYNWLFLDFLFENTMLHYRNLYPYWGNSQMMTVKVILDAALYFCISDVLFFANKLQDYDFMAGIKDELVHFNLWYKELQDLFRAWAEQDKEEWKDLFVDLDDVYIYNHYSGLIKDLFLDSDEVLDKLYENLSVCRYAISKVVQTIIQRLEKIGANFKIGNENIFEELKTYSLALVRRPDLNDNFNSIWIKKIDKKIEQDLEKIFFEKKTMMMKS